MSYQIPNTLMILEMGAAEKVALRLFTPVADIKIKHVIVSMFLRDMISQDFQMKLNLYADKTGTTLLLSSAIINNFDIVRVGDYFCELRFDFPAERNLLTVGHQYLLEFELSGAYVKDGDNYLGLILDHDSPIAIINDAKPVIKLAPFFDKA